MKDMSLNIKDNQFWCVKQKRSDELTPYLGTKYLPISSFHVALFKNDRIPSGYMENIYRYVGSSISWILMRGKVIAIKGAHPSQFIFWAGLLCSSTKCMCVYYTSSIAVAFKEEAASFQYSWPPSSSEATKRCCTNTTYTQQAPSFLLLRRISVRSYQKKCAHIIIKQAQSDCVTY